MILGVIADDFTGATDVAGMLVRSGMRTVQVIGVPQDPLPADARNADALVVALKSRTIPAADAVRESLAALGALRAAGARQVYFKYCSTFDSTPQGNIGPVAEALMDALSADFTIACPAFPENGRTIFRGHLFVGDQLLSDSGMRDHPLTPMTDANLVRVLQAQTRRRIGLLRHDTVARGAEAVRARADELKRDGVSIAIADAVSDADLLVLGEACADLPLVTAGSGVALGLPPAYARRGWLRPDAGAASLPEVGGLAAVLSGSCSQATNLQVRHWIDGGGAAHRLDPLELARDPSATGRARAWALGQAKQGPVLVYATAEPDDVRRAQRELGVAQAGELVERAMGTIASGLVDAGVRRLVVAGGETSGAVVQALGVTMLRIGEQIDPGVPWTQAAGRPLLLALKSGNFGTVDFFAKALARVR
jgi:3-dehydrotetronate 4-kinase